MFLIPSTFSHSTLYVLFRDRRASKSSRLHLQTKTKNSLYLFTNQLCTLLGIFALAKAAEVLGPAWLPPTGKKVSPMGNQTQVHHQDISELQKVVNRAGNIIRQMLDTHLSMAPLLPHTSNCLGCDITHKNKRQPLSQTHVQSFVLQT